MIQLESFHSITISANLRRLHFIVITDPRNTTVHSVTLEYVANIQGPLCLSPFRSQAFRPKGNSFLSGELRYIDGSACDKGTPNTPPSLKQAAFPLTRTYPPSSLSPPGTHSAAVFNQHSICSQTLGKGSFHNKPYHRTSLFSRQSEREVINTKEQFFILGI